MVSAILFAHPPLSYIGIVLFCFCNYCSPFEFRAILNSSFSAWILVCFTIFTKFQIHQPDHTNGNFPNDCVVLCFVAALRWLPNLSFLSIYVTCTEFLSASFPSVKLCDCLFVLLLSLLSLLLLYILCDPGTNRLHICSPIVESSQKVWFWLVQWNYRDSIVCSEREKKIPNSSAILRFHWFVKNRFHQKKSI